jgi:large subunit ribosomal protein L30
MKMTKIAIVRIRGIRNIKPKIRQTLSMLRLSRPNHCVVVESTPQMMGMVELVKDYVAYGPINEGTLHLMLAKRGEKGGKALRETMDKAKMMQAAKEIHSKAKVSDYADPLFRLHPPKGGLKDIKLSWPIGELGKRDSMDSLVRRMV